MTSGQPARPVVDRRSAISVPSAAALPRRAVLLGGGVGIASMVLPSAAAAASTLSFGPQNFTYALTDRTVAAWLPFDSGDAAEYGANGGAGVMAKRITTQGITATLTMAGTLTSLDQARSSLVDPEVSGLTTGTTPTFSEWAMLAGATSLDLANAPHLRFTLTVVEGGLTLTTLLLHSVRNEPAGDASTGDVNLAAYVSAPGTGGGAAVLRRTARLRVADGYRHIVITLGLDGRTFTAGDTITVRLYPYATAEARVVRFARFDSDPAPVPLTAGDTIDEERATGNLEGSGTEENGDGPAPWMAAFIGTYTEPPESPAPG